MPSAFPITKARTTKASQPQIAFLRCVALQWPMRAAMFLDLFKAAPFCTESCVSF